MRNDRTVLSFLLSVIVLMIVVGIVIGVAHAQGPAYPYQVNLAWTASTSPGVTGQNMYRAPYAASSCGTFVKLNSTPLGATVSTYSDVSPAMGAYCYEVTALSPNGESGPSNVDQNVLIPPNPPTGLGATVAQVGTGEGAILAWVQSTSNAVTGNNVYCHSVQTKPWTLRLQSAKPVTKATLSFPAGNHWCAVTTRGKTGNSGLSNVVAFNVP